MNEQWEYFHEVQKTHSSLYPGVDTWEHHFESVRDKTTGEIVARFHDKRYAMMFAGSPGMLSVLKECSKYLFRNELNSIKPTSGYHRLINDTIESVTGLPIEEVLK